VHWTKLTIHARGDARVFGGVLIDEMNGATSASPRCIQHPRARAFELRRRRKRRNSCSCFTGTKVSISALSKTLFSS
jgi:hypothetical protein